MLPTAADNAADRRASNNDRRTDLLRALRKLERDLERHKLQGKSINDEIKRVKVDISSLDDELLTDNQKGVLFPEAQRQLATDATPGISAVAAIQHAAAAGGAKITEEVHGDLAIGIAEEGEKFRIERIALNNHKYASLQVKGPAVAFTQKKDAVAAALESAITKLWKKQDKETTAKDAILKMQDARRALEGYENQPDFSPEK